MRTLFFCDLHVKKKDFAVLCDVAMRYCHCAVHMFLKEFPAHPCAYAKAGGGFASLSNVEVSVHATVGLLMAGCSNYQPKVVLKEGW